MLNKLLGNAVEVDASMYQEKLKDILIDTEIVSNVYELVRDKIIITNERLIYIDIQGVTGSKVCYESIPFSSVKSFSMETAGTFDMDCEIKLHVAGLSNPMKLTFKKGTDLKPIYRAISKNILRDN
ncbi:MAG: PH domain-containing protein [Patescibacteria group bacterium]